jgi:hypothetical protein
MAFRMADAHGVPRQRSADAAIYLGSCRFERNDCGAFVPLATPRVRLQLKRSEAHDVAVRHEETHELR